MAALRVLVTGSSGFLGGAVVAAAHAAGCDVRTTARSSGDAAVDLTAPGMVAAVLEALAPDLVVNLAACARLATCQQDAVLARRVNAWLPGELARRVGARLLHVSTDLVFDGRSAPYDERAAPAPLSVYGASKVEGEELARRHCGRVVRLPLLFGPDAHGRGASASLRKALATGQSVRLFTNEYRTPLHAADAAAALVELAARLPAGALLHMPGPERLSRWEFGRRLAVLHDLPLDRLEPVECADPLRPRDVALAGDWRAGRDLPAMLVDG